jgi:hypothetical protein
MRRLAGLWLLLLAAGFAGQPAAHELQPSSFELRQLTPERYEIIWRAPTYYRKPHPARLQLPENWQPAGAAKVTRLADGALHRRLVDIPPDTVDGAIIRFDGLEATITDVFARFVWLDGTETTAIARPSQPWLEVVAQRNAWQVAWDYTLLGIDHILSGFDHLTFVLALLLIVSGARRLLITVTSFTIAHSITLAAATLGVMWVPGPPVEAVIALSILFLAGELVKVNRGQPSLTASYPIRRRARRDRPAAKRGAAGAADVQRRRRNRAAIVYRGHSRYGAGVAQIAPRMAGLGTAGAGLWHRRHRRVLADRARCGILTKCRADCIQPGFCVAASFYGD